MGFRESIFRHYSELAIVLLSRFLMAFLALLVLQAILLVLDDIESYGRYMFLFATASWAATLVYGAASIPMARFSASNSLNTNSDSTVASLAIYSLVPVFLLVSITVYSILINVSKFSQAPVYLYAIAVSLICIFLGSVSCFSAYVLGQRRRVLNLVLNNGLLLARLLAFLCLFWLGVSSVAAAIYGTAAGFFLFFLGATVWLLKKWDLKSVKGVFTSLNTLGFISQYRHNWPVALGSNFLLHGDKVVVGLVLPLEYVGLLALYQQLARALSNLTIGTLYQFVIPFFW